MFLWILILLLLVDPVLQIILSGTGMM